MRALDPKNAYEKSINPCYILDGDCDALKMLVKDQLLATIPKDQRQLAFIEVNINTSKNINDIIMAADSYVFGVERKIIFVAPISIKITKEDIKKLEKYFELPADATTIVFEDAGENTKALSSFGETIVCSKPQVEEIVVYISNLLKSNGYFMKEYEIRDFVNYCNVDFGRINSEIKKLMLYKIEEKVIEKRDFESLISPDIELTVFNLANELTRKNFDKAIAILNTLKSLSITMLAASIFKHLQKTYLRLFAISTSKVDDEALASSLGLSMKALEVNKRILASNQDKKLVFKLKASVEYLAYIEGQMNLFYITDKDALNLSVNRIIEIFSDGKNR